MKRHLLVYTLFALLLTTAVAACGGDTTPEPTEAAAAEPTPTLVPTPENLEPSRGQAIVESVQIELLESFPVRVNVTVRGVLPDSCTRIDQTVVQRVDNTYQVIVTTLREPEAAACTMAVEPFETAVELDVEGLPAGTYTVDVNGIQGTFTLSVDNVAVEEEPDPTAEPTAATAGSISGRVWHDLCGATGQTAEEAQASGADATGCTAGPEGTLQANGLFDPEEPGIAGAQVSLFAAACTAITGTDPVVALTDDAGRYVFSDLPPGDYCVFVDAADDVNVDVLDEGLVTAPSTDGVTSNSVDVTLAAGEAGEGINFAWDYTFLPARVVDLANCTNSIGYIADVNIPDDTQIAPGDEFTKSWRLRNNGTCPWTTDYALVFVGGDAIPGPESVPLEEEVAPGEAVELSVTLTAPEELGTFRSNWQIADATGAPFGIDGNIGDAFWVQIVVDDAAPAEPEVDPGTGVIGGVVWEDVCFRNADGNFSTGCSTTDSGGRINVADGTLNFGERGLADIVVILAEGACPADGNIVPATIIARTTTDARGLYRFEDLAAATYCVAIDAFDPDNVDLLIPGNWTFPAIGTGRSGVLLGQGEERLTIDFGWDYVD